MDDSQSILRVGGRVREHFRRIGHRLAWRSPRGRHEPDFAGDSPGPANDRECETVGRPRRIAKKWIVAVPLQHDAGSRAVDAGNDQVDIPFGRAAEKGELLAGW